MVQLGPVEPVHGGINLTHQEATRLHLWVIGEPVLDYAALRVQLGEQKLALRLHFVEHPSQALLWLSGTNRAPIHAIALNRKLEGAAKQLVVSIRAGREHRQTPLFVCDTSYCSQESRELYGAGANGYLCGGAATRQLAAALVRTHRRNLPAKA